MRAIGNAGIAALAIAAAVACNLGAPVPVQILAALLLTLVLPGLAVARALLPGERGAELVLLSLSLSISIAVLVGLILHFTPNGLTRGSWAVALGAISVLGAMVALARRPDRPEAPADERVPFRIPLLSVALLALAFVVTTAAMIQARTPLPARGVEGYTALWLVSNGARSRVARVGVQSSEVKATRYRLDVLAGRTRLASYRFELGSGERRTATLRFRPEWKGTVHARLYRTSAPGKTYRRVRLLVDTRTRAERS